MKKSKRWIALLLALLLCTSLCGCRELEDMRATHAVWQEDGTILWDGVVYRELQNVPEEYQHYVNGTIFVTETDVPVLQQLAIVEIAKKHGIHPAVVCVKWAAQRGQVPIPFSVYYNEYHSNLKSVTEDPLTDEEMQRLNASDSNCRLIKGVVFLWEGAKSWKALWDEE
jgi:hypothetical protein